MDHEVIPCSLKICDLGVHRGKFKSDHGTWGPPKTYFHAYIIHRHGPTGFVVREAKEVLSNMSKSRDLEKEMPFLGGCQACYCSTKPLFGAWLLLLVHVQFTPSEGPKDF
jgi:hypothetical protein